MATLEGSEITVMCYLPANAISAAVSWVFLSCDQQNMAPVMYTNYLILFLLYHSLHVVHGHGPQMGQTEGDCARIYQLP